MKLLVESDFKPAGGFIGAGLEELRWPKPVRPGDELRMTVEILEVRSSRSKPHQGIASYSRFEPIEFSISSQPTSAGLFFTRQRINLA